MGNRAGHTRAPAAVRFWRFVVKSDECWEWTGYRHPSGYGRLRVDGRGVYAHRFAYELMVGPIPGGCQLDHLCRNPSCVRPDHLEPVTPRENTRRGLNGVLTTHCPSGHPYAGDNLYEWGGRRYCRTCKRNAVAKWRERQAVA